MRLIRGIRRLSPPWAYDGLGPLTIGGQGGVEPVHEHEGAGDDDPDQGAVNARSCSDRFNRHR
jgi:hypothetical protein